MKMLEAVDMTETSTVNLKEHIGLLHWAAQKYNGKILEYDELISLCFIGMERASKTYDSTKGSFASYAHLWMRSYVKEEFKQLNKHSSIHQLRGEYNIDEFEAKTSVKDDHQELVEMDECINLVDEFKESLSGDSKAVFLMMIGQYPGGEDYYCTQFAISKLGITQSRLSEIRFKLKKDFKERLRVYAL